MAAFAPGRFTWLLGIEDTCVYPPEHFEMFQLDEHELTEHNRRWRDDLRTLRDLGATAIRYGVGWPLAHPEPGRFDWADTDERMRYASELGLTVVADLVHYGTPTWLHGSFADPGYPAAAAEFAGAFAARYRGLVDHITPVNEPLTTASFCGLRGIWPPALTGWSGWTTVVLGIAEGIAAASRAIRQANPDAVIVHVEAASLYETEAPELRQEAELLAGVGMLPTDLALGRVDAGHALHGWLIEHGADAERLARLAADPAHIDLMGVNYYPDLSPRLLVPTADGHAQHAVDRGAEGLRRSLRLFSERYRLPLLITETSVEGDDDTRAAWLRDSVAAARELQDEGVDLRGYTWWPAFDFIDWSYASGGRNVEEFEIPTEVLAARQRAEAAGAAGGEVSKAPFVRRMGLLSLDESAEGLLELGTTVAAEGFARLARAAGADAGAGAGSGGAGVADAGARTAAEAEA